MPDEDVDLPGSVAIDEASDDDDLRTTGHSGGDGYLAHRRVASRAALDHFRGDAGVAVDPGQQSQALGVRR